MNKKTLVLTKKPKPTLILTKKKPEKLKKNNGYARAKYV